MKTVVPEFFLIKNPGLHNFIKNEALARVFSCEVFDIFQKIFFANHLRAPLLEQRFYRAYIDLTVNIFIYGFL